MKRKILYFSSIITILCGILAGCSEKNDPAQQIESISIKPANIIITVGQIYTLKAETVPAVDATLNWLSSDPAVVSVV